VEVFSLTEDGTKVVLSLNSKDLLLGQTAFFHIDNESIYIQAASDVLVYDVDIEENRKALEQDPLFLRWLAGFAVGLMDAVTKTAMVRGSLEERLMNYLTYQCGDHSFKGLQKTADLLHCSRRQLQRVLNQMESEHRVCKNGRGSYTLIV